MCNKLSTVSTRHLLITQVVSYNAPFFTTWFCTNWTVLFFPLYFIFCLISTKCESPGNILQESVRNFRDKGFTAGKFKTHPSLNATVAQSKNCPVVVNITIELKNIANKSNNNGIQQAIFQLTSVLVLLDVIVIFLRSIIVLTPNCIFWIVPVLQSVSDIENHTKDSLKFTFFSMSVYYFR